MNGIRFTRNTHTPATFFWVILEARPIRRRISFENVLYFGWPNQPSSDTMRIYIGHVFICGEKVICVITEIRKVNMIDNAKNTKIIIRY